MPVVLPKEVREGELATGPEWPWIEAGMSRARHISTKMTTPVSLVGPFAQRPFNGCRILGPTRIS